MLLVICRNTKDNFLSEARENKFQMSQNKILQTLKHEI